MRNKMASPQPFSTYGLRTGLATTAMVLGIGSLLLLGFLAGVPAIILGFIALSRVRNHPETYGGKGQAATGIVTGSLGTIFSCLAVLLFLALKTVFLRARD